MRHWRGKESWDAGESGGSMKNQVPCFGVDYTRTIKKRASADDAGISTAASSISNSPYLSARHRPAPPLSSSLDVAVPSARPSLSPKPDRHGIKVAQAAEGGLEHPWAQWRPIQKPTPPLVGAFANKSTPNTSIDNTNKPTEFASKDKTVSMIEEADVMQIPRPSGGISKSALQRQLQNSLSTPHTYQNQQDESPKPHDSIPTSNHMQLPITNSHHDKSPSIGRLAHTNIFKPVTMINQRHLYQSPRLLHSDGSDSALFVPITQQPHENVQYQPSVTTTNSSSTGSLVYGSPYSTAAERRKVFTAKAAVSLIGRPSLDDYNLGNSYHHQPVANMFSKTITVAASARSVVPNMGNKPNQFSQSFASPITNSSFRSTTQVVTPETYKSVNYDPPKPIPLSTVDSGSKTLPRNTTVRHCSQPYNNSLTQSTISQQPTKPAYAPTIGPPAAFTEAPTGGLGSRRKARLERQIASFKPLENEQNSSDLTHNDPNLDIPPGKQYSKTPDPKRRIIPDQYTLSPDWGLKSFRKGQPQSSQTAPQVTQPNIHPSISANSYSNTSNTSVNPSLNSGININNNINSSPFGRVYGNPSLTSHRNPDRSKTQPITQQDVQQASQHMRNLQVVHRGQPIQQRWSGCNNNNNIIPSTNPLSSHTLAPVTMTPDPDPDDPSLLSVSQRAQLWQKMQGNQSSLNNNNSSSGNVSCSPLPERHRQDSISQEKQRIAALEASSNIHNKEPEILRKWGQSRPVTNTTKSDQISPSRSGNNLSHQYQPPQPVKSSGHGFYRQTSPDDIAELKQFRESSGDSRRPTRDRSVRSPSLARDILPSEKDNAIYKLQGKYENLNPLLSNSFRSQTQRERRQTQPVSFDDITRANLKILEKSNPVGNRIRMDSISTATAFSDSRKDESYPDLFSPSFDGSEIDRDTRFLDSDVDLVPTKLSSSTTGTEVRAMEPARCPVNTATYQRKQRSPQLHEILHRHLVASGRKEMKYQGGVLSTDDGSPPVSSCATPRSSSGSPVNQINSSSSMRSSVDATPARLRAPGFRGADRPRPKTEAPRMKLRKGIDWIRQDQESSKDEQDREIPKDRCSKRQSHAAQLIAARVGCRDWGYSSTSSSSDEVFHRPTRKNMATSSESHGLEDNIRKPRSATTSSIQDRITQMKEEGESSWRKRTPKATGDNVELRSPHLLSTPTGPNSRPKSLLERRQELETSQATWKDRVEEKDAKMFTVEGKLDKAIMDPVSSNVPPVVLRKDRSSTAHSTVVPERQKKGVSILLDKFNERNSNNEPKSPAMKTVSKNAIKVVTEDDLIVIENREKEEDSVIKTRAKIVHYEPDIDSLSSLPDIDVSSFFQSEPLDKVLEQKVEVNLADFDEVQQNATEVLGVVRRPRPNRKGRSQGTPVSMPTSSSLEPFSTPLRGSYNADSGKTENTKMKLNAAGVPTPGGLSDAALQGLASKENFSGTKDLLRKVANDPTSPLLPFQKEAIPYKPLMLLHIKGRRHVQTRLVEPVVSSINSGDCYVLVTPQAIFSWIGAFCNVIEHNKAVELAQWLVKHHSLGYRGQDTAAVLLEHSKGASHKEIQFWKALGYSEVQTPSDCAPAEEDEVYEQCMNATNCVYRVRGDQLVPCSDAWGKPLKYEILNSSESLVFDFGSEVYHWSGKYVPIEERKEGITLARVVMESGYDFSQCSINPIHPHKSVDLCATATSRPSWVLLGRLAENGETVLFKEKFIDWPDQAKSNQLMGVKRTASVGRPLSTILNSPAAKWDPVDPRLNSLELPSVEEMVSSPPLSAHLVLEGRSVGRGRDWSQVADGIRRSYQVVTHKVTVVKISEFEKVEMDETRLGQLVSTDTYVVRWEYSMQAVGKRDVSNCIKDTGNHQCATFFWQGEDTKVTEKGASALMTSLEKTSDSGPQIRVAEGTEPPVFCNLFGGGMIVHRPTRWSDGSEETVLYLVRGQCPSEASLAQLPSTPSSLRTRSALIVLHRTTGTTYLWIGRLASENTKESARSCANMIRKNCPSDFRLAPTVSLKLSEVEEGNEPSSFWTIFGSAHHKWTSPYTEVLLHPLRMWHLSGINARTLNAIEIHDPLQPDDDEGTTSALPFVQSTLYEASQPALFLMDAGPVLYLWQGWWPSFGALPSSPFTPSTPCSDELHSPSTPTTPALAGSAPARFDSERLAALTTASSYAKYKGDKIKRCIVVYAGLEPESFKQLFEYWENKEEAKLDNTLHNHHQDDEDDVDTILERLRTMTFSASVLRERPLPEGVHPLHLEAYLDEAEFTEIFGISKEDFYQQPPWKQGELKKACNLF